jgi:hypothetical protein
VRRRRSGDERLRSIRQGPQCHRESSGDRAPSAGPGDRLADRSRPRHQAAADDNQLPKEIRAGIISLAIWVNKETTLVMDGQTDLDPLISVNKSIIEGLK